MLRLNVGETQVIPILLPGMTLTVGLFMVYVVRYWSEVVSWLNGIPDALGVGRGDLGALIAAGLGVLALALYVLSMFCGAILSIAGYVESEILDRRCARKLNLTADEYNAQWYAYLDDLARSDAAAFADAEREFGLSLGAFKLVAPPEVDKVMLEYAKALQAWYSKEAVPIRRDSGNIAGLTSSFMAETLDARAKLVTAMRSDQGEPPLPDD